MSRFVPLAIALCSLTLLPMGLAAQAVTTGPVIAEYGPVFPVPGDPFNLETDTRYRVVMDIGDGPEDVGQLNRSIETAARFMNMHVQHGISRENLDLAVVLHGGATRASLADEAYEDRFGKAHPDGGLIDALVAAGVRVYLCGQSAGYHGVAEGDMRPGVEMAVSAMTVHVRLQQEGFRGILF